MIEDKKQKKLAKKAYKKARRKATRPFKGLSVTMIVLSVLATGLGLIAFEFDNTLAIIFNSPFYSLENEDPNAIYFKSDFASEEERLNRGAELCREVESEGATLLKNENNALPLIKGSKVSTFSNTSVNLVYGGTGSGSIDTEKATTLKDTLESASLSVNPDLWEFYKTGPGSEYKRDQGNLLTGKASETNEVPWKEYDEELKSTFSSYGDAAIVTIGRVGGEGSDVEFIKRNELELTAEEKELFSKLGEYKKQGIFKKIVVLINSANALELDFLSAEEYSIDAALWIGDVGQTGVDVIGKILVGDITPSGRLADTFAKDNLSSPAMVNFDPAVYTNSSEYDLNSTTTYYSVYQEGIYVGYKYYETRYEDYVLNQGNPGSYIYDDIVAYPFGYGESYTEFSYELGQVSYSDALDEYTLPVTVMNIGDTYSGKETVQIYAQSPYTDYDRENNIEKTAVSLVGFDKTTKVLAPGEKETLNIKVSREDLASYDAYKAKTYVFEDGTYYLTAAKNAHDAVNNILSYKGKTPENTSSSMDATGDSSLVFSFTNTVFDKDTYSKSKKTEANITNQFDHADVNLYDGIAKEDKIVYLSRKDWEGTFPKKRVELKMTDTLFNDLRIPYHLSDDNTTATMPKLGQKNGLKLYDLIGKDYNDQLWEKLLDQLTIEEMEEQIGDAFHWTMPIESVQAPGSRDENGPQGLTASLFMNDDIKGTGFTSKDVLAATFNRELAYNVGKIIGNDCVANGVSSLYGTGANIHRTPYGGRNFEYYSEDGYLSGEICAEEVKGVEEYGVDVMIKHFVLNDNEKHRAGVATWTNEQAMREIYLKAFEASFVDSNVNGVMTAFNRVGAIWAGGNYNLLTGVLKNEWGCIGRVITDNATKEYMNLVDVVMAGGTIMDAMIPTDCKGYKDNPVVVNAMREAVHRNLYALANSCAMNGIGPNTIVHKKLTKSTVIVIALMTTCYILLVLFLVPWILFHIRFKKRYKGKSDKDVLTDSI